MTALEASDVRTNEATATAAQHGAVVIIGDEREFARLGAHVPGVTVLST